MYKIISGLDFNNEFTVDNSKFYTLSNELETLN